MAQEHTPGPWLTARTNEGEGYVLSVRHQAGGTQHAIAVVWDDNNMAIGEGAANARLIAAAPELLEALRVAECAVEELCQGQDPANQCWFTLAEIRAAIAKATGK